ncbi:MAG TPA: ABC transporter permease [Bryobacteraceae bacterium]
MSRIAGDLRHAVRNLARAPGFTAIAAATLALGIGTTTAMFSVAHAVLWRPLPYAQPDRLVELWETNPLKHWTDAPVAPANYADWRKRNNVFTDIAAYNGGSDWKGGGGFDIFLTGSGEPQRLKAQQVTGNLFSVLGEQPLFGRTFTDEETFEGKDRVVVLSHQLWQSAFGGDRGIVGRTVSLNARNYVVIGVMPAHFFFPSREVQLWIAMGSKPQMFVQMRRPHFFRTIARLRPGVSAERAQAAMSTIASQLEREYPDTNIKMGVGVGAFRNWVVGDTGRALVLLLGAVGFLLLIVCANVANLQLGRAARRSREMTIRTALGASRTQLVQQLLIESLVVSLLGGLLGLGLAAAMRAALVMVSPAALPLLSEVRLDSWVILFNIGVSLLVPVLFGILPAYTSSRAGAISDRSHAASAQSRRARGVLITCEIALSVVLVTGAGLLVESLVRLEQVHPGFNPEHVLSFNLQFPGARYPKDEQVVQAVSEIERRLRTNPRIEAEGVTSGMALKGSVWTGDATVEGRAADDYERELRHKSVTPDYFRAMGTPLLRGRMIDEHDGQPKTPPVTLVNDTLARKYFRGADPIGKRIKFGRPTDKDPWTTVIGVVGDEKQDGMAVPVQPEVYVPFVQETQNGVAVVIRSAEDPSAVAAFAREQIRAVDKDLALTDVMTLRELVHGSVKEERFRTTLLSGFAGMALLLAAIGIYGVLAYLVTQRTREIGIRMALGAEQRQLLALIFRQGMAPVVLGVAIGLAGALASARLIRTLLFGVDTADPATYAVTTGILLAVAMCACYFPARRAARVDPLVALRDE